MTAAAAAEVIARRFRKWVDVFEQARNGAHEVEYTGVTLAAATSVPLASNGPPG